MKVSAISTLPLTGLILLLSIGSAAVAQWPNVATNGNKRTKSGKPAPAGSRKPDAANTELSVTAYVEASIGDSGLTPILMLAQGAASRMFGAAGVRIHWRAGQPKTYESECPVLIEITSETPESFHPGALAYAQPFEGSNVRIFYDRVRNPNNRFATIMLLAHVLVHEITHILEGVDRHTAQGVMKARWTQDDLMKMTHKPLPFDPVDVLLIRDGLANRGQATRSCSN